MSVKSKVLSAGVLFFLGGQMMLAQKAKNDTVQKEKKIEEVVIVGYQKKTQDKIAQSQSVITGEQIMQNTPTTTIGNALQGKASGVFVQSQTGQPGSPATMQIRGISGVGGSSEPLYVVNGLYMTALQFSSINPNDVASIIVLKDAAATAQYGSRGANGVVVVTTKSGFNGKTVFSFESKMGYASKLKDKNFTMMNARELLEFENTLGYLGHPSRTQAEIEQLASLDHDWQKDILRNSAIQSYLFSAQGGNSRSTFYYSLGYDKDTGILKSMNGIDRYTGRFSFTNRLNDKIKVGIDVGLQYQETEEFRDRNNSQNPFAAMYWYLPYKPVYDANGEYNTDIGGGGFNVLEGMETNPISQQRFRSSASLFGEYKIIDGLTFKSAFNGLYDWRLHKNWLKKGSVLDLIIYKVPTGTLSRNSHYGFNYTFNNGLNYAKKIGDHNIDVLGFVEFNSNFLETFNASAVGLKSPNLDTPSNTVPSARNTFTGTKVRNTLFSMAALGSYDYAGKYIVTGSIRRDGSSRFGANNRYGVFWSGSLAWNIAKEDFVDLSFLNDLKVRGSYGTTGNDGTIPNYVNVTNVGYGLYGNSTTIYTLDVAGNPDVKWEVNKTLNLGIDFALFNRRFRGAVEVYQNKRKDFLQNLPSLTETGNYSAYYNVGDMSQKGLEAELNVDIIKRKDFLWSVRGNVTFQKNRLDKLANGATERNLGYTYLKVGETPYLFHEVRFAGVDSNTGSALYYDLDGNITPNYSASYAVPLTDKSPFPKSFGGFGTTFEYKGFDLNADFVFKLGGYTYNNMYKNAVDPTSAKDNYNVATAAANHWKKPGDTNVFQKVDGNGLRSSDQFIEKSDYLRFRSLTIGYTFDKKIFGDALKISKLRTYIQAQNLYTWTNFHGEPEVSVGSAESSTLFVPGSYNLYTYPAVRTILVGMQLEF